MRRPRTATLDSQRARCRERLALAAGGGSDDFAAVRIQEATTLRRRKSSKLTLPMTLPMPLPMTLPTTLPMTQPTTQLLMLAVKPTRCYALLPQGTDQPYGTTYLPPLEAKAAELGMNLTIANSELRRLTQQASECEVAVAARAGPASSCGRQSADSRCARASRRPTLPASRCRMTNADVNPEDAGALRRDTRAPTATARALSSAEMFCEFAGGAEVGTIHGQRPHLATPRRSTARKPASARHVASSCARTSTILADASPATGTRTSRSWPRRRCSPPSEPGQRSGRLRR